MINRNYTIKGEELKRFKNMFGKSNIAIRLFGHYKNLKDIVEDRISHGMYEIKPERRFLRMSRRYVNYLERKNFDEEKINYIKNEIMATIHRTCYPHYFKLSSEFPDLLPKETTSSSQELRQKYHQSVF
jgi:hypothetical protein